MTVTLRVIMIISIMNINFNFKIKFNFYSYITDFIALLLAIFSCKNYSIFTIYFLFIRSYLHSNPQRSNFSLSCYEYFIFHNIIFSFKIINSDPFYLY
jgi:hypothetical protein